MDTTAQISERALAEVEAARLVWEQRWLERVALGLAIADVSLDGGVIAEETREQYRAAQRACDGAQSALTAARVKAGV
jgi:hypothetical protein